MKPLLRIALPLSLAFCSLALTGCAADARTASPVAPGAVAGSMLCPISGEPVSEASPNALYGIYPVYCSTIADAKQFASLSPSKRAAAAAEQVLPQKRIANRTCPLSGETLTAAAAPVTYEGVIIGFASVADANQFGSLAKGKKAEMIAAWRANGEPTLPAN
ncbi:MAG: hypothetical protein JNL80_10725 [Phycisphaerae bacterium]|nr:hypothetical protein [Phycisphaerae bacterium]